ncbi:sensor histidine kinase [Negadavirga shengliensis]|uniref:histidine kinase n=1 Tax=Negadavirga shengliensis TaxID=1389218 RepID=A0ABV9T247_9BACT
MKLINIITFSYLVISVVVLLIGGLLIFKKLEAEIDFELGKELERQLDRYAEKIASGDPAYPSIGDRLEVKELPATAAIMDLYVRDTVAWHQPLEQMERQLKASRSYKINGKHYYLATYNTVIETNDITETVVQTMLIIFLLLLVFTVLAARLISRKILNPFYRSLEMIRSFSFKKDTPLVFPPTKTEEFTRLNGFLEKMSVKLLKDYRVMKEFSENLSHEIQTPVAVVRGKLELLLDTALTDQQVQLITSAYRANDKITRTVHSLSVLAKLENLEFEAVKEVCLSEKMEQILDEFNELILIKGIGLEKRIEGNVKIVTDPYLAEMLLNNLVVNAIKHNVPQGNIRVELTDKMLVISNTGKQPTVPVTSYFERFKKEGNESESIGLGLAIVKQICQINGFDINYQFLGNRHVVTVGF